ncbi:hypothetical protein [Roseibium sediminicola]|uniref:Uncharacterized protein n=1 Tax=Roseibium sediminicola TaxID=2933272 RepID=A0ABT0GRW5_9HYPH|nr:hypothetical protein [Roseibium sp. CAU 1639]MCK7612185.1 hypothetical protein [Roseibium sp. CAU 1639]
MPSFYRSRLKKAAFAGAAFAATALVLLQLVFTAYSVKEFWFAIPSNPSLMLRFVLQQLITLEVWAVLLSTSECLVLVVVLAMVYLKPGSAWKVYLAYAILDLVSLLLSYGIIQSHIPGHLLPVVLTGYGLSILRSGVTLAILFGIARLAGPAASTVDVDDFA